MVPAKNKKIISFFFRTRNYKLHLFLAFESYEAEVKRQFLTQYLINVYFTTRSCLASYSKFLFLINSWWQMVRHLVWSLMGIGELDTLDSADGPSVILVHFLYGAFLIMGVILLVNMMIALLSNTYQKVQVRSLKCFMCRKTCHFLLDLFVSSLILEQFSHECRKTKSKVITLANHKGHRQSSEPIKTRSKYM